jgi:AMP-binding enzyme
MGSISQPRTKTAFGTSRTGSTEVTSSVTYTDPDADDEVLAHTVGRPDPELDVRLRTDDGRWGGAGEEGEVCVRHPSVVAGYYNRPEETAAVFTADGWLRTGDRGLLRGDGNLRLIARYQEMFKSGGYNIYPREIELALESHPAVAAAALVSRPDADYQAVGVAFIEPQPGTAVTTEQLAAWCRQRLAGYKVPKQIHIIDSLPLLPAGKIDRLCLPGQRPSKPPIPTGSGRPEPVKRPGAEGFLKPPGHTLSHGSAHVGAEDTASAIAWLAAQRCRGGPAKVLEHHHHPAWVVPGIPAPGPGGFGVPAAGSTPTEGTISFAQ